MKFASSQQSTLGIEWELQLVDADSNDLRQSADFLVEQFSAHPHIHREMLLNTIELTSGVHSSVSGCVGDLTSAFDEVSEAAAALRIELTSAGSHPFANPAYQRVTDKRRYRDLVERTQYWGRQMLLFGTHVHVGIDQRDKVLPILAAMLTKAYHIQALSASSPFWNRTDTGYATNRAMYFQQLPTAGVPRQFQTWDELEEFERGMLATTTISHFNEVRWDVRPSPTWGTLEIRVADANTNISELAAVAALTHCLVDHYSTMYDRGYELPRLPEWFVSENRWRSARYGMDAWLIVDSEGREECVKDSLLALVDELAPTAKRLGCEAELARVSQICEQGAAYERLRAVSQCNGGSLEAVTMHMREETRAGKPLTPRVYDSESTDRAARLFGLPGTNSN